MRVLLASSEFPPGPGGIGTHAYQLANALVERGVDVCVAAVQHHAPENEQRAFREGLPFPLEKLSARRPGPTQIVERMAVLRRSIRRFGPDVLLASGNRVCYLTTILGRLYNLPTVLVEHGSLPNVVERQLRRVVLDRADAIVSVSEFTRSQLANQGIDCPNQVVILNAADAREYRSYDEQALLEVRQQLGLGDRRVLLTVGQVSHRKGQEVVVRALPEIVRHVPQVHYVMVGLPSLQAQLSMLARELGVYEHITFLGRQPTPMVAKLMNLAEVFVMTSQHADAQFEGFGIAVIEAALCGTPAVVAGNSGLVEAVDDKHTGLVVPKGDPDATARAVLELLQNDGMREAMGAAAASRARTYTWRRRAEEYEKVLTAVLQGLPLPVQA